MKNRFLFTAAAAIAILSCSSAGAAMATSSTLTPTGSEVVTESDSALVALQELSETQTDEEIDAILNSSRAAELLFDSTTGEYTAARYVGGDIGTLAITPVGPGCTTTSVCMLVGGQINYGFTGSGTLNGTWNSVTKASAGSLTTHFFYANSTYDLIVPALQSAIPTPPINVNKLQR